MKLTVRPTVVKVTPLANGVNLKVEKKLVNVTVRNGVVVYNTGSSDQVFGEVPSGTMNGSNATFTSEFDFVPETVQLYVNGLLQKKIADYNTTGVQTIILTSSPSSVENILLNYTKA